MEVFFGYPDTIQIVSIWIRFVFLSNSPKTIDLMANIWSIPFGKLRRFESNLGDEQVHSINDVMFYKDPNGIDVR